MALSTTATAEDLAPTRGLSGGFADNARALDGAFSWGAISVAAATLRPVTLPILGVGLGAEPLAQAA
jgi:hypothetical protein